MQIQNSSKMYRSMIDCARYVYKQEVCRRCGTPVRRWDLAGRFAYACPVCQRPPRPKRARSR